MGCDAVVVEVVDIDGDCGSPVTDNGGVFVLVRSMLSADPLIALEIRLD